MAEGGTSELNVMKIDWFSVRTVVEEGETQRQTQPYMIHS